MMDEQTYMDFTTALGEEYHDVISPLCEHGADPHDGYEVFAMAYGLDGITPEKLQAAQASSDDVARIRDFARQWHKTDRITDAHVREALQRIVRRWPPTST